jgi:hypothetical protein
MSTIKFILTIPLLCLLAVPAATATTYYIATSGSDVNPGTQAQPFRTIGKGIVTATSGDTILVGVGTFAEHIVWTDKSLNVQGAGAGQSVIDGLSSGSCLTLTNVPTTARLAGFTIRNGLSSTNGGGGMFNTGSHLTIANCAFTANRAGNSIGGAIFNLGSSPTVTNCIFTANTGRTGGGIYNASSNPRVINCAFTQNKATSSGGGMANFFSNPILINCKFFQNSCHTGNGGGMMNISSLPTLTHCTLNGNIATTGGGIFNQGSSSQSTLNNCIVWGNVVSTSPSAIAGLSQSTVTYSDVQGGYSGTGNIDADPLFVNFAAGDTHLQATSPCVDKGTISLNPPLTDLDGAARVQGSAPDMGAYEFGSWFVDKASGSDTNSGIPTAPFATITRAITTAVNGNNIYIKQGNYGSDQPRITKLLHLYNWGNTGLARIGQP